MKTFSKITQKHKKTQKTAHNFFLKLNYFYIILKISKLKDEHRLDNWDTNIQR